MIDIEKAKNEFENYVESYNPKDKKIALKIGHTKNVTSAAEEIAVSLNLNEEDKNLAILIALLHDIGRFEQIKRYNTFNDGASIDHANFGVHLLFEEGLIRKFIETKEFDEIINKAIYNHNKLNIQEGLTDRELLHAKIIRDADKIDIFRILAEDEIEHIYDNFEKMPDEEISSKVYNSIITDKRVNYLDRKNDIDKLIANLSFVYDLNFAKSYEIFKNRDYVNRFINRISIRNTDTIAKVNNIIEMINKHIEEQLSK